MLRNGERLILQLPLCCQIQAAAGDGIRLELGFLVLVTELRR